MTNYICYINNKQVELGDTNFEIVKSIANYKELEARGTVSKSLTFPQTPINDEVFGFLYDLNSDNWDTTKKYPILLYADNYLLLDGWFELTNVVREHKKCVEYSGTAYAGNNMLFANIKDKDMEELDLSELNFTLTNTFVANTYYYEQLGINNNAAIYTNIGFPYIDYGKRSKGWLGEFNTTSAQNTGLQADDVYPGIKMKYLIDKIFTESNCSYESTFIESDEFSKFIVPFCNDLYNIASGNSIMIASGKTSDLYSFDNFAKVSSINGGPSNWTPNQVIYLTRDSSAAPWNYYPNGENASSIIPVTFNYSPYEDSKYGTSNFGYVFNPQTNFMHSTYRALYDCNMSFDISIHFVYNEIPRLYVSGQTSKLSLVRMKWEDQPHPTNIPAAGAASFTSSYEVISTKEIYVESGSTTALTFDVQFNVDNIDVEENDVLFWVFHIAPANYNFNPNGWYHDAYLYTNYATYKVNNEYVKNATIHMDQFWLDKDIQQSDFLADVMKMFNLQIYPDSAVRNLFHIEPYENFVDRTNALVLTDYLDETLEEITFINNYKNYQFSFKEDDIWINNLYFDKFNKQYGSYLYETDNELTDETASVDLKVFSCSPIIQLMTSFFYYGNPATDYCDSVLTSMYNDNFITNQVWFNQFPDTNYNPRMLCYDMTKSLYSTHYFKFNNVYYNLPFATHLGPNVHGMMYTGGTVYQSSATYVLPDTYDYTFDGDDAWLKKVFPLSNQNLFNRFYGKYIQEIGSSKTKMYTAKFNLPFTIINQIELNKMVYIDYEGFFLINEMRITPGALTEMDLIKLDNVNYTYTKYKKPKPTIHNLTVPEFPGNYVPGPQGNGGFVIGEGNIIHMTNEQNEWTGYTITTWFSGSTSSSTYITGWSGETTTVSSLLGTTYTPTTASTNKYVFGNNNIVRNSDNVTIFGNNNYVKEDSRDVNIMNSSNVTVNSGSSNVSILGSSNITVSSGISNLILVGKQNLDLTDVVADTNKIYFGDTTGMTVDMRGNFLMQGKMTWDPNATGDISVQGHKLFFDTIEQTYFDYNTSQLALQTWVAGSRTMIHEANYSYMYNSGPRLKNEAPSYTGATLCVGANLTSGLGGTGTDVSIISNAVENTRFTSGATYFYQPTTISNLTTTTLLTETLAITSSGTTAFTLTDVTDGNIYKVYVSGGTLIVETI